MSTHHRRAIYGAVALGSTRGAAGNAAAPGAGQIALHGPAPTILMSSPQLFPGAASIALHGEPPLVTQTHGTAIVPGPGDLTLHGEPPTITQSANQEASPGAGQLALTGPAPTVTQASAATYASVSQDFAGIAVGQDLAAFDPRFTTLSAGGGFCGDTTLPGVRSNSTGDSVVRFNDPAVLFSAHQFCDAVLDQSGGSSGGFVGPAVRLDSAGSGYGVSWNAAVGLYLNRYLNGAFDSPTLGGPIAVPAGTKVRLTAVGTTIRVERLDTGAEVVSAVDATYLSGNPGATGYNNGTGAAVLESWSAGSVFDQSFAGIAAGQAVGAFDPRFVDMVGQFGGKAGGGGVQAIGTAGGGYLTAYFDSGAAASPDQFVEYTYTNPGGGDYVGASLRNDVGSLSAYYIGCGGGTDLYLWRSHNGFFDALLTNFAAIASGSRVRVEVFGTSFRIYVNGVLLGTATDATIASGRPGLCGTFGGSPAGYVTDFLCGDL